MKEHILNLLEQNRGEYLSGAAIAEQLGISREAVNKAVDFFRQSGFQIDAVAGKGYRLAADCDKLSVQGIRRRLCSDFVHEILLYDETDSTNLLAKREMRSGKKSVLVAAQRQSAGRGRLGKSFYSPDGSGIYMTVGIRPKESVEKITFLTVAAAVAVARAIDRLFQIQTQIKWVNDIYFHGKKLCGILTEAELEAESGRLGYAVIGIGVNLRVPNGGFPEDIRQKAGALEEFSGEKILRNRLIAEIVNQLEEACGRLDSAEILEEYRKRSCIIGKSVSVLQTGKDAWNAEVVGIDERARLLLRTADGKLCALSSGDVSIVPCKVY